MKSQYARFALAITALLLVSAITPEGRLALDAQRRGVAAFRAGHIDEAIAAFEESLAHWPAPTALYNLGLAHERAGHSAAARAAYFRYLAVPKRKREATVLARVVAIDRDRNPVPGYLRLLGSGGVTIDAIAAPLQAPAVLTLAPGPHRVRGAGLDATIPIVRARIADLRLTAPALAIPVADAGIRRRIRVRVKRRPAVHADAGIPQRRVRAVAVRAERPKKVRVHHPCTPACGARVCGDDGCGGRCGACPGNRACLASVCVDRAAEQSFARIETMATFTTPALLADGVAIFASKTGDVVALDRGSKTLWTVPLSAPIAASPVVDHGQALVSTMSGSLVSIAVDDGRTVWRLDLGEGVIAKPVAVDFDGTIYVATLKKLCAVTRSGVLRGCAAIDGAPRTSALITRAHRIVIGTAASLAAFDRRLRPLWSKPIPVRGMLALDADDRLLVPGAKKLLLVDAANGAVLAEAAVATAIAQTALVTRDDTVIVPLVNGTILGFHDGTLTPLWTANTGGPTSRAPILALDDLLYAVRDDATYVAFETVHGQERWHARMPTADFMPCAPALGSNGLLWVSVMNRDESSYSGVYAVAAGDGLARSPWPKIHGDAENRGRPRE